jgi:hypothetical protein
MVAAAANRGFSDIAGGWCLFTCANEVEMK